MPLLVILILLPLILCGGLCFVVGNALPALFGGAVCTCLAFLSGWVASEASQNGTSGGLGVFLIITLPLAGNALILLLGSGIYYLSIAVG